MSMQKRLKRLARLSPRDWVILIQLVAFAALLEIALRFVALPRLCRTLARGSSTSGGLFPLLQRRAGRRQLFECAFLAARIVRGQDGCLPRSLLLFWLLSARREPVALLIGVRKDTKRLYSHAWIETPSMIRNETNNHGQVFLSLLRFSNENV